MSSLIYFASKDQEYCGNAMEFPVKNELTFCITFYLHHKVRLIKQHHFQSQSCQRESRSAAMFYSCWTICYTLGQISNIVKSLITASSYLFLYYRLDQCLGNENRSKQFAAHLFIIHKPFLYNVRALETELNGFNKEKKRSRRSLHHTFIQNVCVNCVYTKMEAQRSSQLGKHCPYYLHKMTFSFPCTAVSAFQT